MTGYSNLRERLQHDLRDAHSKLDDTISLFDLTVREGFIGFLRTQECALSQIPLQACREATRAAVEDLTARARTDLTAFGTMPLATSDVLSTHPQSEALDYVIGGSCLGSQVLKKRWQSASSSHQNVGAAYMNAPNYLSLWRDFCDKAKRSPAHSEHADRVVHDAAELFALFSRSAVRAHHEMKQYV